MLEEPERELVAQHAPHRFVQLGLREQAALDGPDEHVPIAVRDGASTSIPAETPNAPTSSALEATS
jgi:hypothetical protein